ALASPFLVGLLDQPFTVEAGERLEIIGIRCFPWTVFDLLGLAPGSDRIMSISHPIADLQPRLAACVRAGRVDRALAELDRYRLWGDPAPDLAGLAQALGYADQSHLSREFKRYSGMTPAAFVQQRRLGRSG